MNLKTAILISSFFFCFSESYSQSDSLNRKKVSKWQCNISYNIHAYSYPFVKSFATPIQSGLKFGAERQYFRRNNSELLQSFNLGHFRDKDFLDAYYLNSHIVYRYHISSFFASTSLGAGYYHRRYAREVFKLNNDGEYESKFDWGNPGIQFGFSLGAGYNLRSVKLPISVFIEYEWFASSPQVKDVATFMAHSLYHIGVGYKF
jgi:hypothetical protein